MAKNSFKIGDYLINDKSEPFMIAEIGINHNGDMHNLKRLIDASNASGWHCVKFQKRTPDLAVPEHQKNIPKETPWGKMTYLEYKYKIELGKEEYDKIDTYCRDKPIMWSASPWDIPSLEFILKYDIPFIKIASATNTKNELLIRASQSGKPVILSTGMSTIEEIDNAVNILETYGNGEYVLMHTNSNYPAKHEDLNLRVIQTLKDRYNCIVGYSGHEIDLEPTVVAVVLGAKVIERHITLDHNMWGTDQSASLEVHAIDMLYKRIKGINAMLGNGKKVVTDSEIEVRKKLRG